MAIVPQGNPPDASVPSPAPAHRPRVYITLTRSWLALIAVLIIAPWGLVGMLIVRSKSPQRSRPRQHPTSLLPSAEVGQEIIACQPGPWGDLELIPILISPPLELVDVLDPRRINNDWIFAATNPQELQEVLRECGLTEAQADRLLANATLYPEVGMVVKPDREVRSQLSPSVRANLYNYLALNRNNLDQTNAFRFSGDIDAWFHEVDLEPETVELVKRYVYQNGDLLFFGDLPLVVDAISHDEMGRLIKVLSREQTYLVKLRVKPGDELNDLVDYWSVGGRLTDARPMLDSILESSADPTIDVTHLLPPFARRRLYTYPRPQRDKISLGRDCHWTALNFFHEVPNDAFATDEYPGINLKEYQPVEGNPRFGDLVVFRQGTKHFHSAIYIADDLVYTKNGAKLSRPWMLMRLKDLMHYYPQHATPRVDFFRLRTAGSFSSD